MLSSWLDRLAKWRSRQAERRRRRADCRPAPPRLRARLEVEPLEGRLVPAAIRNLPGFLTNNLPANDDGSTGAVNVGFNLNFFNVQTSQVFVNNNGNITFNQPLAQFTPSALNTNNGGIPIIASYFADVDTRGNSNVVTFGNDTLCGRAVFGVDFIHVNYFDATASGHVNKFDDFQLILIDRSDTGAGNFDIEFNYNTITWETGDASGGTNGLGGSSARVGFSNGTGTTGTFFELPGSGVNGAFLDGGPQALINTSLMSGTPGRLHFLVRNGQVVTAPQMMMPPMVNNDVTAQTRVFYPLRYITQLNTQIERGNLTIINSPPQIAAVTGIAATDACLDIAGVSEATGPTTATVLQGPITVVFPTLFSNVTPPSTIQVVNATGVTASGHPFITVNVPALPPFTPVLRAQILLQNPSLNAPTTFYMGFPIEVFAGAFDPTSV
ncbi:MAG: hypothetical protein HYS12_04535 [Planctomycetes bacterium]|nr:hypothetical protein [Planctomycetota bacterium]